jgi:WS/DGAT/MGAT family acyltransferase
MSRDRLSTLDASFLRLETATEHMHVAWRGAFAVTPGRRRPTLAALRALVAGRLRHAHRFRQRLAFPPAGLGEPFWVDDEAFDIEFHVRRLGDPYEALSEAGFRALADGVLSRSLDRRRPLWEIHLAPRLHDGRVGLVMKMHHAMVDGISAVQLALLMFSDRPDAEPEPADEWRPRPAPSNRGLALRALADSASESLRTARGLASLAGSPVAGSGRLADGLRRTALAVGDDLLRPAPSAHLNRAIGGRRTLVGYRFGLDELLAIKQRTGTTHNDVCLAIVTGALRELGEHRGESRAAIKAMIPVSTRPASESTSAGNRISFAFIDLPVGRRFPLPRLRSIHEQTDRFKRTGRAAGTQSVLSALRFAPSPVKTYAARLAGSPRVYNLTVSNVPGPRVPMYMLGAELVEAYPVVPLSDGHTLSIGMFTYRGAVHFGLYADPQALPEVSSLPLALARAAEELERATRPARRTRAGTRAGNRARTRARERARNA